MLTGGTFFLKNLLTFPSRDIQHTMKKCKLHQLCNPDSDRTTIRYQTTPKLSNEKRGSSSLDRSWLASEARGESVEICVFLIETTLWLFKFNWKISFIAVTLIHFNNIVADIVMTPTILTHTFVHNNITQIDFYKFKF